MDMLREMCQVEYGLTPGMFTVNAHRHLKGGEEVDLGGMTWEIMHIPGHSMGSIALYNRSAKILIPGDVVYADCAIGRFDLHGADRSELRRSLMRLAALEVHTLLPGHNRIVTDLSAGYILQTAKQWEPYLI